jgi:prolyl-tRNA editing enzyme YbaK/EbsC (Cys-tRNA(Pro) deacylase)
MSQKLSASAKRVQQALAELGLDLQVVELPASTRTAQEAAAAIGCQVGQIVKSLVFRGKHTERPFLVVASGSNRVNEKRLAMYLGEPVEKADAEFVRAHTGYAIGGVPPVGHDCELLTCVDEDLFQYEEIWAAAGTPHAVFRLTPADLEQMTAGQIVDIT